ncbi:PDZ domain-containing protein [Methylacidimicrobium cyclopophantes]|uniref:PDZ domain-containing protein n=1 Tax=Methylacidimicrobium cyclopophantes TaxID=1041766 RepID=UPI00115A9E27|nr:PDZ domain-containing protein [Methylacidimicrobium cyclopophantes]
MKNREEKGDRERHGEAAASPKAGMLVSWTAPLVVFLIGWCGAFPLFAQGSRPLKTIPPLSAAFPLVQEGREVHVAYPLAINDHVVVPRNARLHFLYQRPQGAQRAGEEGESPRADGGGAIRFGGMGLGGMGLGGLRMGATVGMPRGSSRKGGQAGKLRAEKVDRTMVWRSCEAFREALSRRNGAGLRLVFSLPAAPVEDLEPVEEGEEDLGEEPRPQPRRVRDEPVLLPLGLLLAQRKGAATVLAVEEGSAGEEAGLRARDRIVSLNGRHSPSNLGGFLARYRQERERGLKELRLVVERAGVLSPISLTVPLPPRPGREYPQEVGGVR